MKTLGYFRNLEEGDGRGDSHEALRYHMQPGKGRLVLGDYEVKAEDLAAPIRMHQTAHDAVHTFCMTGLTDDVLIHHEQNQTFPITEQLSALGQYVLVIRPRPFLERFRQAADREGFSYEFAPVIYYDAATFHGETSLFHKRNIYEWQQEVRIISNPSDQPFRNVELGSLADISGLYETAALRASGE